MKTTADRTSRSTTPVAASPGFVTVKSRTFKANLPTARIEPLAHRLGEIAIVSDDSESAGYGPIQRQSAAVGESPVTTGPDHPNNTGLPDSLKAGIESLSGFAMSDVRVHFNSSRPARFQALAFTQGTQIHVARGHEQHLPHEAWHVVQQLQGRVKPTMQMNQGVPVNDDDRLEREADVMGTRAVEKSVEVARAPEEIKKPQSNPFAGRAGGAAAWSQPAGITGGARGAVASSSAPIQRRMTETRRKTEVGQKAGEGVVRRKKDEVFEKAFVTECFNGYTLLENVWKGRLLLENAKPDVQTWITKLAQFKAAGAACRPEGTMSRQVFTHRIASLAACGNELAAVAPNAFKAIKPALDALRAAGDDSALAELILLLGETCGGVDQGAAHADVLRRTLLSAGAGASSLVSRVCELSGNNASQAAEFLESIETWSGSVAGARATEEAEEIVAAAKQQEALLTSKLPQRPLDTPPPRGNYGEKRGKPILEKEDDYKLRVTEWKEATVDYELKSAAITAETVKIDKARADVPGRKTEYHKKLRSSMEIAIQEGCDFAKAQAVAKYELSVALKKPQLQTVSRSVAASTDADVTSIIDFLKPGKLLDERIDALDNAVKVNLRAEDMVALCNTHGAAETAWVLKTGADNLEERKKLLSLLGMKVSTQQLDLLLMKGTTDDLVFLLKRVDLGEPNPKSLLSLFTRADSGQLTTLLNPGNGFGSKDLENWLVTKQYVLADILALLGLTDATGPKIVAMAVNGNNADPTDLLAAYHLLHNGSHEGIDVLNALIKAHPGNNLAVVVGAHLCKGYWDKGTFSNVMESIFYHHNKHGGLKTVEEYTRDARTLWSQKNSRAIDSTDEAGRECLKIPGDPGGLFKPDRSGKIYSFWYT
jgi:hypothetical protein